MHYIVIIKTAHYMHDSVYLANIGQELIPQPLTFAGAFYQAGNVYKLNGSRNDTLRFNQVLKDTQALVRHADDAHVRLNGTKREVGRLGLVIRNRIKKC